MISLKRLSLLMLPAILMLLVAACGDDPTATPRPTATPVPAPEPTATPEPAPDPTATPTTAPAPTATPTPEPEAPSGPTTWTLDQFVVEDGKFELRVGPEARFGYDANQRVPTIPGLIEIIIGPIQVGDTIQFNRCRQSGSRSTQTHHLTVEKLGVDFNLDDGRFGADPPGGSVGSSDDPNDNCVLGPFTEPGEYLIDDSTDPGAHGVAKIIVEGEAMVSGPTVWTLDQFVVEDGKFELRVGSEARFGYDADQRVPTIPGLIEIVLGPIQVGDTIVFNRCRQSGSRSTQTHHLTVEKLGVDFNLDDGRFGADPPGGSVGSSDDPNDNCVLGPFTEPGEYLIDDSTDPGGHGVAKIIVEGEAMVSGPTVWTLDQFVVEDGKFELRVGSEAKFGYNADQRVPTIAGLIEIVIGPIQVGDTIVFNRCRQSGSRSTITHHLTVEKLGIDFNLDDGRFGADPPGGSVGSSDDPNDNCVLGPFTEPGEYIIDDSTDPGAHGVAKIIVEGEAMEEPAMALPDGVTYNLDRWQMEDGLYQLRVGDAEAFGYPAGARIDSRIVITVNAGDTISFGQVRQSGSRSTKNHHFAIEALGIDVETGPSLPRDPFSFTPTEIGTFVIDDPTDPGEHGIALLIVEDGGGAAAVTYNLDRWQAEDGLFQLRVGDAGAFGYDAGARIDSRIVITITLGDTINFGAVRQSSSRSTKNHHFAIADLGIDVETGADLPRDPFSFRPDKKGTFVIDDPTDPGVHGIALLIVE